MMGDRDSPGQVGAFGNGIGGDLLRSSKTQGRLDLNKRQFNPKTKVDQAIVEAVGADPDDVEHFRELLGDAHRMVSTEAQETNDDLRNLLANFGYSGKKTAHIIQAVRRKHKGGGDADQIPRFDEMVDMARRSYSHLLNTGQGESVGSGDYESALWERLRSGFEKLPSRTDQRVMSLASQMFKAQSAADHDHQYDPDFDVGDEWTDNNDYVPFSTAADRHAFIIEHYVVACAL